MAQEPWFLKEDGYLNVNTKASFIIHHPNLNVILVCTKAGEATVIDVNSGDVLQSISLVNFNTSEERSGNVGGRYLPGLDKVLFWNDQGVGLRSDYNGVLLLHTILQMPAADQKQIVKLELLLSEAILLRQSLKLIILPSNGPWADFASMLDQQIDLAKSSSKKGIKAQKWNTVELNLPYGSLRRIISGLHADMRSSEQCVPGMAIVASLHERLANLAGPDAWNSDMSTPTFSQLDDPILSSISCSTPKPAEDPERIKMYSEAARRKTFDRWPHMDYKWALPDQMAQAGFYHKPTAVGDDRAMCFTCSVCLVCWDRTDEPWSEHERHSPGCPFVKGEYTQNVPISVTYATGTADRCPGVLAISSGDHPHIVCTGADDGKVTVWSVSRELERQFEFQVTRGDIGLEDDTASALPVPISAIAVISLQNDNQKKINTVVSNTSSGTSVQQQLTQPNEPVQIMCAVTVQDTSYLLQYEYSSIPTTTSPDASSPVSGGGTRKASTTPGQKIKDDIVVMYVDDHGQIPQQLGLKKKKKKLYPNKEKFVLNSTFNFPIDQDHQGAELFGIPENPDDDTIEDPCTFEYIVDSAMYDKQNTGVNQPGYHHNGPSNPGNILAKLLFKSELPPDGLEALITKYIKYKGDKNDPSVSIQAIKDLNSQAGEHNSNCLHYQTDATDFSGLNGYASIMPTAGPCPVISGGGKELEQTPSGLSVDGGEEVGGERRSPPVSRALRLLNCLKITKEKNKKQSVSHLVPARDGKYVVVILKNESEAHGEHMEVDGDETVLTSQALVYAVINMKFLSSTAIMERTFLSNETPVEIRAIPARRRPSGLLLMTCQDGIIRLIDVQSLATIASTSSADGAYVSAVYCSGLSRLCASTEQGLLRFYSLDSEDLDEEDEEEESTIAAEEIEAAEASPAAAGSTEITREAVRAAAEAVMKMQQRDVVVEQDGAAKQETPVIVVNPGFNKNEPLANKKDLLMCDLRQLHSLTIFDEACFPYGATVPACWCRLVQAQKQRRQPQRVRAEDAQHAYAWRLQNDATTWDEHIFELTLPFSCTLGHVDFKFSLHTPCNMAPNIQVTLLKQLGGIGHHGKSDSSDHTDSRSCSTSSTPQEDEDSNPVLTSEYLRAQHAELLAGPVQLMSGVDLSGQGGVVTLTSPALMKIRTRSLLLHVKTMFQPVDQEHDINTPDGVPPYINIKPPPRTNTNNEANGSSSKGQNYLGCDWLHEVAISVRSCKAGNVPHGRQQRAAMLESDILLQNLLKIATQSDDGQKVPNTRLVRSMALDIIGWLLNVRLARNRLPDAGRRQADCARIVQANLDNLVAKSLLAAGRSEARKCVKLVLVCSNGVSDLPPDAPIVPFDQSLLRSLLRSLQSGLPKVRSASALRWYCLLLIRYAAAENRGPIAVAERCLRLLRRAAAERSRRTCPYTDLLKARFGLNGVPFDAQTFDVELPQQVQQRSLDSVLGNRKPRAVSDLADMTAKPIPSTRGLRGLGEVQPLHFSCHSASEGTRIEAINRNANGAVSTVNQDGVPNVVYKQFDIPKDVSDDLLETTSLMNSKLGKLLMSVEKELAKAKTHLGHKDIEMEISEYPVGVDVGEDMSVDADDAKSANYTYLHTLTPNPWSPASATTSASPPTEYSQMCQTPTHMQIGDEFVLPWSRLLTPPAAQVILVERMHSCARRFVVLDFGRPILLTDLAIPSCGELMSLALDYWLTSEDTESTRLALAADIGTRSLVMKDLQPPPVFRYLKMTMIGRYGMTAARLRLSAGRYYGHSAVLEADAYADNCSIAAAAAVSAAVMSPDRIKAQLPSLDALYEDTACRYRLACCNLRDLLKPLLGLPPSLAEKCAAGEDEKVLQAYQECISVQQQLNVLRSVISRLREASDDNSQQNSQQEVPGDGNSADSELAAACTDKLRVLCESLVVVLLQLLQKTSPKMSLTISRLLDYETCSELFSSLVVHGDSASQISCCALLGAACNSRPWWGAFLADSLQTLYSSSCTLMFAKERVFLLLTHLGRRGNPRSRVLDAALLALLHLLTPIAPKPSTPAGSPAEAAAAAEESAQQEDDENGPLSARIDLSLLSWLLMYLSACLDNGKENNNPRWDFMSGQAVAQRPRTESERNQERAGATRVYRRKLQKRLMHHKIQLDDLESAKKAFQVSSQALSNLSSQTTNLTAKLDAALKQQENAFKKTIKIHTKIPFKHLLHDSDFLHLGSGGSSTASPSLGPGAGASCPVSSSSSTAVQTEALPPPPPDPMPTDTTPPDPMHSLAVCRALLALLLRFDSTCGADTFLITCKVLSKLAICSKPVIALGQLATAEQLQQLIRRCVWTDGRRPQWAGAWAQHAATCLLQDLVEAETKRDPLNENLAGRSDTSSDYSARFLDSMRSNHNSPHGNLDIISMDEPEDYANSSLLSKNGQLSSLMESDDSELEEFLDDVLDRGRNLLRRNEQSSRIHTAPTSNVSSALDARLEAGLDTTGELLLRRLKISAATKTVTGGSPNSPSVESPSINTPNSLSPDDQAHLMTWIVHPLYTEPAANAVALLSPCFDALFMELHSQSGVNLEALLRLWTALNDQATCRIILSSDSLRRLVSALAWLDAIPLRAWSLGFQCLSVGVLLTETMGGRMTQKGAAAALLEETDFRAMLVRFLSGDGDITCAGPTACQAMYKCLLRLKSRCEDEAHFRNAMLRVLLRLLRPGQPVAAMQGPQDAQARFVHGLLHAGYERCDLATAMTVIESISALVSAHTARCERVRCRSVAECSAATPIPVCATAPVSTSAATTNFGGLFACVLGNGSSGSSSSQAQQNPTHTSINKTNNTAAVNHGAGRHASAEALLVPLLRLANRLVCTPLLPAAGAAGSSEQNLQQEPMDTGEEQTDERKAERLSSTPASPANSQQAQPQQQQQQPLLADTVLRHGPTTARLLRSLCSRGAGPVRPGLLHHINASSSSTVDGQSTEPEPRGVADALYVLLDTMVRVASDQTLVAKPLYDFLYDCVNGGGNTPRLRLTLPLLALMERALTPAAAVRKFAEQGGVRVICEGLVRCHRGLVSTRPGRVSAVMMCLGRRDAESVKGDDRLENLAPLARINAMSGTAQSADALLLAAPAHRRARTPAWSYHFYPEESHADLLITLPAAALLREVQVQPHLTTLATCPSAIAIEISPDANTPFSPVCAPMACSGMTLIRMQLPRPEVASRILIRLYKPRDNPNLGLTQIRLLGCSVFNETGNFVYGVDGADEEHRHGYSSGWLRLLQQCLNIEEPDQLSSYVSQAAAVPGLLRACCALLIAPSTCHTLAHNLLLRLTTQEVDLGLRVIDILLRDGSEIDHACIDPTAAGGVADHVAELLGAICSTRAATNSATDAADATEDSTYSEVSDTYAKAVTQRAAAALDWLLQAGEAALRKESGRQPCACCIHELAAVLWAEQAPDEQHQALYTALATRRLTITLYRWTRLLPAHCSLKQALDAVLCAACRLRPELLHALLRDSGAAVRDARAACVSDDSKGGLGMTDDSKHRLESDYTSEDAAADTAPLAAQDPALLRLDEGQLETLALVCQSNAGVGKLFSSGLLEILTNSILVFVNQYKTDEELSSHMTDSDKASGSTNNMPMATANGVAATLNFLAELCAEKEVRDCLGTAEGSAFWNPLLMLLCCNYEHLNSVQSSKLEAATINFLSRVTACNKPNQKTLATVLCQVISAQSIPTRESPYTGGISGFTRRLVLQLLLRSERIMISVFCEDNVVPKPGPATAPALCVHPALRPRTGTQLLVMPAHSKLQDLASYYTCTDAINLPVVVVPAQVRDSRREQWEYSLKTESNLRDKRTKEAKNYAKRSFTGTNSTDTDYSQKSQEPVISMWHPLLAKPLPGGATLSQLLSALRVRGLSASVCEAAMLDIGLSSTVCNGVPDEEYWLIGTQSLATPIEIFSSMSGLSLLAQRLPVVPAVPHRSYASDLTGPSQNDRVSSEAQDWMDLAEWVKLIPTSFLLQVETGEEVYCDDGADDLPNCPSPPPAATLHQQLQSFRKSEAGQIAAGPSPIPAHALAAFALFLRLPGYAEVLLRDRLPAQCLLRLMLGVSDDGEGNDIFSLPTASVLPTLPFCVLRRLLDATPLTTDDGLLLRLNFVDVGALHLVLGCLAVFTHHTQETMSNTDIRNPASVPTGSNQQQAPDKGLYWAKGTGFGTGSTQQSWNVEQALARQRGEEQHVTSLLQVLSAFINPGDMKREANEAMVIPDAAELLPVLKDILKKSCLLPAVSSYLRNDSVLDMARHVPLHLAVLLLLRALAQSNELATLLLPSSSSEDGTPIADLLATMKQCVDTYAMRLRSNSRVASKSAPQRRHSTTSCTAGPSQAGALDDDDQDGGLAVLIPGIQETAGIVQAAVDRLRAENESNEIANSETGAGTSPERPVTLSLEQRYLQTMRKLQFDTYEMMAECTAPISTGGFRFTVPYHYENSVRAMGNRCCHPGRVKRLAQEAVTLSTSLPLSYSSSVFVRCDTDRLDVMKVLITGPAETPYANGCFELDIFFPPDYPASPMQVHLETTGRQTVRFNPNLYNDGKVCLSVLNTWHGRPEEKWNAQTSSFLQVLVSIQSLILVPEPYFNEPGYERCRGTPSGANSSREYNANIYQACVRWAMLEQLRQPCACFKEVIQTHFWMKRHEIVAQVESWIAELESHCSERRTGRIVSLNAVTLKRYYKLLREELAKLPVPEGMSELDQPPFSAESSPTTPTAPPTITTAPPSPPTPPPLNQPTVDPWAPSSGVTYHQPLSSTQPDVVQDAMTTEATDTDVEMEKIVSDVLCE